MLIQQDNLNETYNKALKYLNGINGRGWTISSKDYNINLYDLLNDQFEKLPEQAQQAVKRIVYYVASLHDNGVDYNFSECLGLALDRLYNDDFFQLINIYDKFDNNNLYLGVSTDLDDLADLTNFVITERSLDKKDKEIELKELLNNLK